MFYFNKLESMPAYNKSMAIETCYKPTLSFAIFSNWIDKCWIGSCCHWIVYL